MKKIIFNPLLKVSNVNRYSGVFLIKPETVSDHITQVGLMAILCANELNQRVADTSQFDESYYVDMGELALKCLVHDIDECLTCDIAGM